MVSIVMASYNSARWIKETIACIQAQTYSDWELIITDDASTDNSAEIIQAEAQKDSRIHFYRFSENSGAGKARNNSLSYATGRFISYLDADDLWTEDKLEKQLKIMRERNIAMCFADYDIISENGELRKTICVPDSVTYEQFLRKPLTCTHTVMFDTEKVDKKLLIMPDVRRGQDAATWLQVLRSGVTAYALHEPVAKYRRHEGSLSSNKITALKRTWYLYREIEHLSLPHACVCFVSYVFNAIKKYA